MSCLIENTNTYINEYIGEKVDFSPINESLRNRVPIAISGEFNLYSGRILNCDVVLAFIEQADIIPPKTNTEKTSNAGAETWKSGNSCDNKRLLHTMLCD